MKLDLGEELTVIAMTRALTERIERMGHGVFLADPEAKGARDRLYALSGLDDYTSWMDLQAATRLRIWAFRVRMQEALSDA